MRLFFYLLISISLFSCDSEKKELKQIISAWKNKEIVFPSLNAKFMGKDTIVNELFQQKYKILTYIDTTGCTACKLQLFDWKLFIKEIKNISSDVDVLFVIFSKDYNEFEEIQKNNLFKYPVFYDTTGKLDSMNKFPHMPDLRTFLLDKNNKVLAIGNPITNNSIKKLYTDIIQKE